MENTEYSFESNDLLYKVFRYRKPLLIITLIGFVAATIVSFCITPLFKSEVVIFPAPSLSTSQELIATQNAAKKESIFGEDKETEQILQVLNSDELREKLISKYNLWHHYDLDSANISHPNDKMLKKFKKNISFRRTEYSAVEISVLDEYPDTAALIANDIAGLIDTLMNGMEKRRAANALNIVQYEYNEKVNQLKTFEDSLSQLMQKGVSCNLDEIEKDIAERDHRDMTREISPLTQAPDAVCVDSSNIGIEETVSCILDIIYKVKG